MSLSTREKWTELTAMWFAAFDSEKDHIITLNSPLDASRLRAELYRVVRRAKKPRSRNEDLIKIAGMMAINIKESTLTIYRRVLPTRLIMAIEQTDEVLSTQSLKRIETMIKPTRKEHQRANPYFKR